MFRCVYVWIKLGMYSHALFEIQLTIGNEFVQTLDENLSLHQGALNSKEIERFLQGGR